MGSGRGKHGKGGGSLEGTVQILTGSSMATMTYLMYLCMKNCAEIMQAMQHYH